MTTPLPTPWPEGTYSDDLVALLDEPGLKDGLRCVTLAGGLRQCAAAAVQVSARLRTGGNHQAAVADLRALRCAVSRMLFFVRREPVLYEHALLQGLPGVSADLRHLTERPPKRAILASKLMNQARTLLRASEVVAEIETDPADPVNRVGEVIPFVSSDPAFHLAGDLLGLLQVLPRDHRSTVIRLFSELLRWLQSIPDEYQAAQRRFILEVLEREATADTQANGGRHAS